MRPIKNMDKLSESESATLELALFQFFTYRKLVKNRLLAQYLPRGRIRSTRARIDNLGIGKGPVHQNPDPQPRNWRGSRHPGFISIFHSLVTPPYVSFRLCDTDHSRVTDPDYPDPDPIPLSENRSGYYI